MKSTRIAVAGAFALGSLLWAWSAAAVDQMEEPRAQPAQKKVVETPRTLHGYVEQEKFYFDFLKQNHPLFTVYEKENRLVGKYTISDREEEFVEFGGGKDYHAKTGRTAAVTYRLPAQSFLDLPNQYVGSEKCGECHPMQYEKWLKSRHNLTVRFPDEVTEVKSLTEPIYGQAPVLPDGITPDVVSFVIGTPRTKYGYLDAWLVRGTYHIEGGTLKDRTGQLVAGGNQHSRTWAQQITPEVAKQIATWVPGFPTRLEDFGDNGSARWGMTSYGAKYRKTMMFQPASAYCETCHSMKFDFTSKEEFLKALGNPAELKKHTVNKGISCEECHGAGAHLVGARGAGMPSNCERCHQRFTWTKDEEKFNSYFKSRCPSCGTEGSQAYFSAHKSKGMTCATCHDPHEVTSNDWRDAYTVPALKKQCQDCHVAQTTFFTKNDVHGSNKCSSCHMPSMMSCENFTTIQFPDYGGFDTQRTAHIWKIAVDPEAKSLNPPAGKPRDSTGGPWRLAKGKDGKNFVDLMWSCGRTSWADDDLVQTGGCHSPTQSQLGEELKFKNQKQIYDHVVAWQKPVKDGVAEVKTILSKAKPMLVSVKAGRGGRAEAQLMANQAQDIIDAVEKDGSWGVHAPRHTLERVKQAKMFAEGAVRIASGKPVPNEKLSVK